MPQELSRHSFGSSFNFRISALRPEAPTHRNQQNHYPNQPQITDINKITTQIDPESPQAIKKQTKSTPNLRNLKTKLNPAQHRIIDISRNTTRINRRSQKPQTSQPKSIPNLRKSLKIDESRSQCDERRPQIDQNRSQICEHL